MIPQGSLPSPVQRSGRLSTESETPFELPQPATLTVHPQITKLKPKRLQGQGHRSGAGISGIQNHAAAFIHYLYPIPDTAVSRLRLSIYDKALTLMFSAPALTIIAI